MKKLLRLLPAFACLALVAGLFVPKDAAAWPNRLELKFRTTDATNFARGYVDSTVSSGTVNRADTTATIDMSDWVPMSEGWIESPESVTLPDSVAFFGLFIVPSPTSGITTAADSIYYVAQVSLDGVNWVTATPTGLAAVGGFTIGTVSIALELASSNTFGDVFDLIGDDAAAGNGILQVLNGATAPSDNTLYGFPFIRFIIQSDINGVYKGHVGFWTANDMP